jgi:hypothetical protein
MADRRHGVDRRAMPRRWAVARLAEERRQVVDRRRGAERRSTLERRGRPLRRVTEESPGEHVRNALQLLAELHVTAQPPLAAAVKRLERALRLLERHR